MGAPQEIPARFPCWCRATYSWGGESKKDLGFIEGDLIEALNAGDGLWWMGRLRRDPRAVGLFPSNFVKVLDESFQPAPSARHVPPPANPQRQNATPVKGSLFRKPFQAYEEVGKRGSMDSLKGREGTPEIEKKKKSKFAPYSSMKTVQAPTGMYKTDGSGQPTPTKEEPVLFRVPSPPPRGGSRSPMPVRRTPSASPTPVPGYAQPTSASLYRAASPQPGYSGRASPMPSRSRSPLPSTFHDGSSYPQILPSSRQPSPNPYAQQQYRAHSPAPAFSYHNSRAPSPVRFYEDAGSSPPPPPPPAHRVAYTSSRPPSRRQSYVEQDQYARGGAHSPIPPSPGGSRLTPSPLRDAMNDVMSSLQDMSVLQPQELPSRAASPPNVWSPDAFELVRSQSKQQARPRSSLGFASRSGYHGGHGIDSQSSSRPSTRDGPPRLDDYVQRMERQLRHSQSMTSQAHELPPPPPPKGSSFVQTYRPTTSSSQSSDDARGLSRMHSQQQYPHLSHRKSGAEALNRTYTTKTNATNSTEVSSATQSSTSTQQTNRSLMSGYSAGGFSATSAGSLARRKFGLGSQKECDRRAMSVIDSRPGQDISSSARSTIMSDSSGSGPSYHSSHASGHRNAATPMTEWSQSNGETNNALEGLVAPKAKKSNFFRKMIDSAKTTARTGAAGARSTMGSRPGSRSGASSPSKSVTSFAGGPSIGNGFASRPASAAGDMGLGGGIDWMQVRRDINRSNSLSRKERDERADRCQMLDLPVLNPVDQLHELAEGDEGLDGLPVAEPMDFNTANLALVDKNIRMNCQSWPTTISTAGLAQSYICRPYRSDVQRLRAIFTWVSERIAWEDDFEGQIDTRRVVQAKRGCSEEIAFLVQDLCRAVGLHAEIVRGYLKAPGEALDLDTLARPNHWWNAAICDGQWRIIDCSLARPSHPKRSLYSSANGHVAELWYFLARPLEVCYTHIPLLPEQQHIVPPVPHEVLATLPCACPPSFKNSVELADFDTSMLHLENLEMAHLHVTVPEDVECVAEVETKAYAHDNDGDLYESGNTTRKPAFAQADWIAGRKRFTIKAVLPGDSGTGVLKVYAGKRGLMHSIKDNPHPLAFALPLSHIGQNPPYDFLTRHPTPHAQRHDLYVAQPQCSRLVVNNTFVFCIRQHPSSLSRFTPDTWGAGNHQVRPTSPNPQIRPSSAMSMVSATTSMSASNYSDGSSNSGQGAMTAAQQKPAKLAIQTPSQKIIRLTRKQEYGSAADEVERGLASSWEAVIKIGERGVWRGLVLADRSARWCVFAEWDCV